jgi:hypothetical protein
MASRSHATEMDLLASTARTTGTAGGHRATRPSPCKGEPDVGRSPNPRGARHDGGPTSARERVGNPSPTRHRALQIADGKSRFDTTGGCHARCVADGRVP